MTAVYRLVEEPTPPAMEVKKGELPQCEAQRITRYIAAWENNHPDKRCRNGARFVIDGMKLCRRHAGVKALDLLLRAAAEKKIDASGG